MGYPCELGRIADGSVGRGSTKADALDRSAPGLGVLGGGGGPGLIGICGGGPLAPTDYAATAAAACYPPGLGLGLTHPQPPGGLEHAASMTPTSAPVNAGNAPGAGAVAPPGPNNPVAMSQLGTVYATKRRRRNGKR